MPHSVIALRDIVRSYRCGPAVVRAIDNVDTDFGRGSWTAITGRPGSGKSTLLHCAAGVEELDRGTVLLDDTDIKTFVDHARSPLRRIRMSLIYPDANLIDALTAEENIGHSLRLAGRHPARSELRHALTRAGLRGRAACRVRDLSRADRQRVAVARAILTRPRVLFADEPTGGLDTAAAHQLLDVLRTMVDAGQTVVTATGDPATAARADAVTFLQHGRIADRLTAPTPLTVLNRLLDLEP